MKDYMVRATAANAQIRAFACTTRETVETARAAHNTSPVVTAALGRLLSAGVMMGSMLKGDDELITLQIKGDGPIGGLTVTADRNGHVKGYANVPDVILPANAQGKLDVGGAVGAGVLPASSIVVTEARFLMFSSSLLIVSSSAKGINCTIKPPACLTVLSLFISTPSPTTEGTCSDTAK